MDKKINFDNIFTIFYIKSGIILLFLFHVYIVFLFLESEIYQVHINVSYIFLAHVK